MTASFPSSSDISKGSGMVGGSGTGAAGAGVGAGDRTKGVREDGLRPGMDIFAL